MAIDNVLHDEGFSGEPLGRDFSAGEEAAPVDSSAGSTDWAERLELRPEEEGEDFLAGLPDALVATYGELTERALKERRAREATVEESAVSSGRVPDTTVLPFRAVACLLIEVGGRLFRGSGFFISPRTLATAGHNVFLGGSWADRITVIPGLQSIGRRLFLPFGRKMSTRFASVSGWMDGTDHNYDYGAIQLDTPLGNAVGWFGLGVGGVFPGSFSLIGYPDELGTQVQGSGQIIRPDPLRLYYNIPTAAGQSGGPVFPDTQRIAIAIHAYYSGTLNSGVRVTEDVRTRIESWRT